MTHEALYELVQKGNQTAYSQLFDEFFERNIAVIRNVINDGEVASELALDVWRNLWTKRDKIEIEGNFRSYVFRACRNAAINYYHRQLKHYYNLLDVDNLVEESSVSTLNEAEIVMKREGIHEQVKALLTESEYRIWKLWVLDYKNEEIAALIGISKHTVENKKPMIKDKLKEGFKWD